MPTPNLHWQFFVKYFRHPKPDKKGFTGLKEANDVFYKAQPNQYPQAADMLTVPGATRFTLRTTYPGLLTGSGYRHETGSDDELKLGFSFDFTTGLPILPGSSVKGLLRSAFPGKPDAQKNPLHDRRKAYLRYLLKTVGAEGFTDDAALLHLERELFGGEVWNEAQKAYVTLPMQQHDTFYDALIGFYIDKTGAVEPYRQKFMGNDFITPHRNRKNPAMSPFTNPVPIQFLKVLPTVPVTFQFGLPTRAGELLTPEQRQQLYKQIITDLGVGAKTRVGYGQLR